MQAGCARHLRNARDGHFHVCRRDQHQVRQFIDNHDDVTQPFGDDDVLVARDDDLLVEFNGKALRIRFNLLFL